MLFIAILLVQVATLQASGRQKRLVLDANTDIVQEIVTLRAEMAAFNNTIENMNNTHNSEMAAVNNIVENMNKTHNSDMAAIKFTHTAELENLKRTHSAEMTAFMSKMKATFKDHGSTYIRWGRTSCGGGNGTQLIYKGYMAGSEYRDDGNGANQQCLPEDPTWGKYDDANQGLRAYIYGTEFQEYQDVIFGKHVLDEAVPCTVCYVPGTSLMIPARSTCYPGWSLEYTGYLMASVHDRPRPSNYVCVDSDPDFVTKGAANTYGHLLYLVEGRCETLVCPPYVNHRELTCSVCSKVN